MRRSWLQRGPGLRPKVPSWVFKGFFLAAIIAASSIADARSMWTESYVEQLKNRSVNYQSSGTICEEVTRLELSRTYNPRLYDIRMNISYGPKEKSMGELDVVIFDQHGEAILIAEVKCWTDPLGALMKARQQQDRFQNALDRGERIDMWGPVGEPYYTRQFQGPHDYLIVGPAGTRRHGFDMELRLTLEQMHELQATMLDCQKVGYCVPRPNKAHENID